MIVPLESRVRVPADGRKTQTVDVAPARQLNFNDRRLNAGWFNLARYSGERPAAAVLFEGDPATQPSHFGEQPHEYVNSPPYFCPYTIYRWRRRKIVRWTVSSGYAAAASSVARVLTRGAAAADARSEKILAFVALSVVRSRRSRRLCLRPARRGYGATLARFQAAQQKSLFPRETRGQTETY
jgi:hypothetical protein